MSHFSVLIIGDNVEEQLAPYNENIEVEPYVEYTKEQLIEKWREEIEEYKKGTYAKYLNNPEKYIEKYKEKTDHIKYISEEFPKRLQWTDEEIYNHEIQFYEPEEIGKNWEVYSTYNPKSKWDWYEVWGRWTGELVVKQGVKPEAIKFSPFSSDEFIDRMTKENRANTALMKDIDLVKMKESVVKNFEKRYDEVKNNFLYATFVPHTERDYINTHTKKEYTEKYYPGIFNFFAIVKDWIWYEKGTMQMFGMSFNHSKPEDWNKQVEKLISNLHPDTRLTVVDCHI